MFELHYLKCDDNLPLKCKNRPVFELICLIYINQDNYLMKNICIELK